MDQTLSTPCVIADTGPDRVVAEFGAWITVVPSASVALAFEPDMVGDFREPLVEGCGNDWLRAGPITDALLESIADLPNREIARAVAPPFLEFRGV